MVELALKTNLFNLKNNKEDSILLLLIILGLQVVVAYIISKTNKVDNIFVDVMYLPIILAAFMFDYKIGILSGIIGELLIAVFMPAEMSLNNVDHLQTSLIQTIYFISAGLFVGIFRNFLELKFVTDQNQGETYPYMNSPNWNAFINDTENLIKDNQVVNFRFILIEISNQNELLTTFNLENIQQVNEEIITRIRLKYKSSKIYLIRLDAFALVFPDIHQNLTELINLLDEPFTINGIPVYCEITLGESSYPESGNTPDDILKNSFLALNEAKQHQKPYQQYSSKLIAPEVPILLGQFKNAINNNEIEFHYQPIIYKEGKICALEALVRWNHPIKGQIPPDDFIPNLEFTRITNQLTYYSMEYNLGKMKFLYAKGFNLDIALNISITNLFQPDFSDNIINIIKKHKFPPHHLSLEITERGFLADDKECRKNLDALYLYGVKISMDDFGAGSTSISNFQNKGINSIKIDKSFVQDIHINKSNQSILKGLIAIAKSSNIMVIAEGIEKVLEKEKVLDLGVDCLQGYLISKPLDFKTIQQWLKEHYKKTFPI